MKILITGGSGLLGQYLNIELNAQNKILTLYNTKKNNCENYNSYQVDLANEKLLVKIFEDFKPAAVVHTAAISRPELCEELPTETVLATNIGATKKIAEFCLEHNSKLIFTSTDLVYDGNQGGMLKEESKINPLSIYAESKLKAEEAIRQRFDNYIILRTSLLYGISIYESANNFHKMFYNLKNGKPVNLFYDQFRTPLWLNDAARMINELIRLDIQTETINFGGPKRLSRLELGEILCEIAGFDKHLLNPISMNDLRAVKKVKDVSLNTDKLKSLGVKQTSIEKSIIQILSYQKEEK